MSDSEDDRDYDQDEPEQVDQDDAQSDVTDVEPESEDDIDQTTDTEREDVSERDDTSDREDASERDESERDESERDESRLDESSHDDATAHADTPVRQRAEFMYSRTDASIQEYEDHIIIDPARHRTSHIMSQAEFTELVSLTISRIEADGMRASMLDSVPPGATTAREIALAEIYARKIPYQLMRVVGIISTHGRIKKYIEVWKPSEMTFPRMS